MRAILRRVLDIPVGQPATKAEAVSSSMTGAAQEEIDETAERSDIALAHPFRTARVKWAN